MRNYVGTCKGSCSYNLVHNFLIQLLTLQSSNFVMHFSNTFWYGNESFPKGSSQNEIIFLCNLSFAIQLIQGRENVFTRVVIKSKIFHTCRTCVVHVALVSHSCLVPVALVSHLCRSCSTRVVLVFNRVVRVSFVSLQII